VVEVYEKKMVMIAENRHMEALMTDLHRTLQEDASKSMSILGLKEGKIETLFPPDTEGSLTEEEVEA
jgi:hypothetical protein